MLRSPLIKSVITANSIFRSGHLPCYMGPRRSSYSVNEVKQGIRSYFTLNSLMACGNKDLFL